MRSFPNRKFFQVSLAILTLMTLFYLCWNNPHSYTNHSQDVDLFQIMRDQDDVPNATYEGAPYKKILYWNKFPTLHNYEQYGMGIGRDGYRKAGCPVWQCETSQDRSDLFEYDAVLFNYRDWDGNDMPEVRSAHQRYIFIMKESPAWPWPDDRSYSQVESFFNWTMTYRWDSDVVHPYAWIEPTSSLPIRFDDSEDYKKLMEEPPRINYAAEKSAMAAWFVSNCRSESGREELVDGLVKLGIQVDRYGQCGNLTCGAPQYEEKTKGNLTERLEKEDEDCRTMAGQKYKFYFALENSLCLDYITEKFFTMLDHPIIPVVMDAHGHHARAAPPLSYINALDFSTVRDLADYLLELDQNDTLYNQYFWWKPHFRVRNANAYEYHQYRAFCSLCAALHDPVTPFRPAHKVYEDMGKWWKDKSDCQKVRYDENGGMHLRTIPGSSPA